MSQGVPEDELVEAVASEVERADAEEYEAGGDATVSPDTGTVYEGGADGEPSVTPHDEALQEPDQDEG